MIDIAKVIGMIDAELCKDDRRESFEGLRNAIQIAGEHLKTRASDRHGEAFAICLSTII